MKPSVDEIVARYVAAWNNNSLDVFKAEFAKCLDLNVKYTDPDYDIQGMEAIAELAQLSLEKFPGRIFKVVTQPEHHHNVARYTWGVAIGNENREGFDCLEFNAAGLIKRIISFF
jgi:hypothetical protein